MVGNSVAVVSTLTPLPVTLVPADPPGPSGAEPARPASVGLSALPVTEPINS